MDGFQLVGSCLAAAVVLLVPGSALLAWLPFDSRPARRDLLCLLADAAALSIAIPAVLALGLFLLGVRLPSFVTAGLYVLCIVAVVAAGLRRWTEVLKRLNDPLWLLRWAAVGMLCLILIAALVGWRLYQARTLVLPAWVDSVHHTLIVRMIGDYGGIPPDFAPYIPAPFFYHYGFHLVTAIFAAGAGLTADQSVIWFGQVLNALVAISVYRLGRVLIPKPEPAVEDAPQARHGVPSGFYPLAAAVLVGFAFQMPAYYLTWGRYTLLAGLVLAGPAMAAGVEAWEDPHRRGVWVRLALLVAGLGLTHIFALLLVGLFFAVIGLTAAVQWLRRRESWAFLWRLAAACAVGLLLAAPWLLRAWQFDRVDSSVQVVNPMDGGDAARQTAADYLRYLVYLIGPRRNHILLGISGVGLLAALLRPRTRLLAAWGLLLALLSLPWGLRVNPFRPDYFAIVLFFPAALLTANLLDEAFGWVGNLTRPWVGPVALALVTAALAGWGLNSTRNILNPATVLVNRADIQALDWVKANTPPDARFYINTAHWLGNTYRGVDGGYWLEPYAQRETLLPPAVYGWGVPAYIDQITRWSKSAANIKGCTPEFWDLVNEAGLSYIYIRKGKGSLQPAGLEGCPRIEQVYQDQGVSIFAIHPPAD